MNLIKTQLLLIGIAIILSIPYYYTNIDLYLYSSMIIGIVGIFLNLIIAIWNRLFK